MSKSVTKTRNRSKASDKNRMISTFLRAIYRHRSSFVTDLDILSPSTRSAADQFSVRGALRGVLSTSSARWRRASASMAAVSYSARSASVIGARDSCLTCSHEDVAVELTDAARMIFPVLLFNAMAGLLSGSMRLARGTSVSSYFAPSYRGIQRTGTHMPRAQHVRVPAPA